jgi:anti-sigma regulatory factor (Ser/Thr protein kinase)
MVDGMSVEIEDRAVSCGEHVVHFYADDAELLSAVGPYLSAAAQAGEVAIVIATESHRRAFESQLQASGVDVAQARLRGELLCLDAAETIAQFMTDGEIDQAAFHELIGGLMRRASASGRAVRAYGEMVALLWDAGEVLAAIELETLWNELAQELPFTLFCSYPAASVLGSEHANALHEVCHLHSAVLPRSDGGLTQHDSRTASELAAEFPARLEAPGEARRLLISELRQWGLEEPLVQDAALVLTELASNAVRHAGTPFSVAVLAEDSTLRIAVGDACPLAATVPHRELAPPLATHGLGLIDALAADWGVEHTPEGKIVWAQLRS